MHNFAWQFRAAFRSGLNHGAWLDHDLLLILELTAWIAANVYAYVHGHTRSPIFFVPQL